MIGRLSLLCLSLLLIGCGFGAAPPIGNISSYREIPGVTPEEIAAIEAVKESRTSLTYGAMPSIETFVSNGGELSGFSASFADLLTRLFGIPFRLELHDWDNLLEGLTSQTIDFTGELSSANVLLRGYYMTQPIKARYLTVIAHESNIDDFVSAANIKDKTIGFLAGSVTEQAVRSAYDIDFTSVEINDHPEAVELINAGIIDAFIDESSADPMFEQYEGMQAKLFFPIISVPVSMTTANPALQPFITVINKYLDAGGVEVLNAVYEAGEFAYSQFRLFNSFTAEEKAYLDRLTERGETVKVAYENSNYPISFYNANEREFQGLAVQILQDVSRLTGIQFQSVMADDAAWSEMLTKLEKGDGEVQIVTELLHTEAREDLFLWTTTPYATSFYAIISKSDYPDLAIHQVANTRVGVLRDSSSEYFYRVIFPDNDNLIEYASFTDCINAIERGEIDLIMGSDYKLLTFIHFYEKSNYKTNIRFPIMLESRFGLAANEDILCSIINKAQQYIDTETMEMRWTNRSFDYNRRLVQQRVKLMLVFIIVVLAVLAVTVLLFINNIKLNKKLLDLANYDMLTKIYNRRHLLELIDFQIARTSRSEKNNFVMIYDLDHFKNVNDTYGHLAGDKVLKTIAQRVRSALRPYDLFGRYGGEEFMLFVAEIDKEIALVIAERVRKAVFARPVAYEDIEISVSVSIGIAEVSRFEDFSEAIKSADKAMYIAKKNGRNRVVFYEKDKEIGD